MKESSSNLEPVELSMNEQETMVFLHEKGIQLLSLQDWKPHTTILWVIDERLRGDLGPYAKFPKNKRPSVARIDDPVRLVKYENDSNPLTYQIENEGGQIDYYAIGRNSKRPLLIKTSANFRGGSSSYVATIDRIFLSADELFPRS